VLYLNKLAKSECWTSNFHETYRSLTTDVDRVSAVGQSIMVEVRSASEESENDRRVPPSGSHRCREINNFDPLLFDAGVVLFRNILTTFTFFDLIG